MTNYIKPTDLAKLTAMICKYHGIDLIYLRPKDVNVDNGRVTGKMFIDNKWLTVETDLPKFIDISPYCFKARNRKIMKFLRENTLLSDDRVNRLSKVDLQERLKEDEKFRHLVIPTGDADNFNEVQDYLDKYQTIVLKPVAGEKGKGVFIVKKEKKEYSIGYQKKEKKLNEKRFIEFYEANIKNKKYMLQKYVQSRSLQGDPFDCRIHVEKNGNGEWVSARNYIRIGIGQKVVSNISQGGGVSDPEPFLKANFGDKWEEINEKLNKLAVTLPYKIEELRDTTLMTMGMDIGIDVDGDLYLFEINGAPLTAPLRDRVAMLRSEYYKYVLQNKV